MADQELEKNADEAEEESSAGEASTDEADAPGDESGEPAVKVRADVLDPVEEAEIEAALAAQTGNVLGAERFVYAAYLAGAVMAAFVFSKLGHAAWLKLAAWKPEQIGEPRDELVYLAAALVGVGVALHYWRRKDARQYATEVAEELSKVTWPSKKEVQNSTFIVVLTTLFATVFFALMDQFWRFITDKVYGF
ncbi:MAG: preprotein translocase subunit SecE [Myxococcales bacterium]|jgi:preprotein translocase subunit SecE|nr:preprotein translocase subunit SecE [Myxococcales bacterium]MBL0196536.1 preprotein translocase subunit SecE [Myxococcales bacterium]